MRGVYRSNRKTVEFTDEKVASQAFKDMVEQASLALRVIAPAVGKGNAVNALADVISLMYKAPLALPVVPYDGKYLANNLDYLVDYIFTRYRGKQQAYDAIIKKIEGEGTSQDEVAIWSNLFRAVSHEKIEAIFEALMSVPADTRPGMNFSSLAAHMSLSSLLAWLNSENSVDMPNYRLFALLHDIGKLTKPEAHVEEGERFFDLLMERLKGMNAEILSSLTEARHWVATHHEERFLPDWLASEAERGGIDDLERVYREKYQSLLPMLHGRASDAAKLEEELEAEGIDYRKLYEDCSRDAYEALSFKKAKEQEEEGARGGYIYFINFPGVQRFISSFSKLRDSSAASLLVDLAVTLIPFAVMDAMTEKGYLPLDALLVAGGGHSLLIGRVDVDPEQFKRALKSQELLKKLGVELSVSYEPFMKGGAITGYDAVERLFRDSSVDSLDVSSGYGLVSYGLHRVCESCGIMPATQKLVDDAGKTHYFCDRCFTVKQISRTRGFQARVNSTYFISGKKLELNVEEGVDAMAYVAGSSSAEEGAYVGVISFDANNASSYFASSKTFSEYSDRALLAEHWIKKGFREALYGLVQKDEEGAKRILAGLQYMGGDEGLYFGPPPFAVKHAMEMVRTASQHTGLTFKIGLLVVKTDHPIQFAIRTSKELMERAKNPERNTVAVLYSPSFVSGLDALKQEDLRITRFANPIEEVEDFLSTAGFELEGESEKMKETVNRLQSLLEFYYTKVVDRHINYLYAYAMRLTSRHESVKDLIMEMVRYKGKGPDDPLPLLDVFFLLKGIESGYAEGVGT